MNSAPNSAHNSNNNSEASSEYSNEVIKEGMISYRKGTFGRWKKSIFRLTGNGIITETSDNRKKNKQLLEIIIRESEVSSGERLTGKTMTVSILSKLGQFFFKFRTADDFNSWFHLIMSYTKRNSLNSFELTEDGVIISNVKGEILSANAAAVEIFGFEDKSELLGKSVSILMPPSVAKLHPVYMSRYEKGGTPRLVGKQREIVGKRKDGTEVPLLIALGELVSSDSRNFIATLKDLSRSKVSKSKADNVVHKVQSNIRSVIEQQANNYQNIVNDAIHIEIRKIVVQTEKAKCELKEAEEEIISLTKKNNQQNTFLNTFKALFDEPLSIFNISFLLSEISKSISSSSEAETLFRTDSVITRHLTLYAMLFGISYLDRILRPFVQNILSHRKSFEINPTRVSGEEKLQKRIMRLKNETSSILHCIFNSLDDLPLEICQITNKLYEGTKEKYEGMEHSISGGFLMLRFICPAIISPESFGLCHPEPSDFSRRNLILISKYIQSAANGNIIEEDHPLFPLADCLSIHIDQMKTFIKAVSDKGFANNSSSR